MNSLQLKKLLSLSLILLLVLTSCSAKKKSGSGSDADSISESDLDATRDGRFADGAIPTAEGEGLFKDVRFNYDSSAINGEARADIEANAEVLKSKPDLKVTLEGHCDERGTNEYNLALGSQRATAVAEILETLGIERSRLETISYGEEVPLTMGQSEAAFAQNRRVHFSAHSGLTEPTVSKKVTIETNTPTDVEVTTTEPSDDSTY